MQIERRRKNNNVSFYRIPRYLNSFWFSHKCIGKKRNGYIQK